jgi:hypothetical protein
MSSPESRGMAPAPSEATSTVAGLGLPARPDQGLPRTVLAFALAIEPHDQRTTAATHSPTRASACNCGLVWR